MKKRNAPFENKNNKATKRQQPDPTYIGATLEEVQQVIREGRLRYAQGLKHGPRFYLDARGAGTKRLSKTIATHMIARRWWKSPPGTRFVAP